MQLLLFCFFIIGFNIRKYHSWGPIGHQTTAALAQSLLNNSTINGINSILAEYVGPDGRSFKSIIEISIYPDEIRPIIPWADTYHYVNMKKNETAYDAQTQCQPPQYCIVAALNNYTSILKDPSIKNNTRLGEALTFIVHFMGDICQPLHAGNVDDKGGNLIDVNLASDWKLNNLDYKSNLHWVWDELVLKDWMYNTFLDSNLQNVFSFFINYTNSNPDIKTKYLSKDPFDFISIANDSRLIALQDIYSKLADYNLDNLELNYSSYSLPIIKNQVVRSGLQMSKLLNELFDGRSSNSASTFNRFELFKFIIPLIIILINYLKD